MGPVVQLDDSNQVTVLRANDVVCALLRDAKPVTVGGGTSLLLRLNLLKFVYAFEPQWRAVRDEHGLGARIFRRSFPMSVAE
jgi:hypothetical protein